MSNRSGRPLSMGPALRLTGAGSAMSLHISTPALLHALRTRCLVGMQIHSEFNLNSPNSLRIRSQRDFAANSA